MNAQTFPPSADPHPRATAAADATTSADGTVPGDSTAPAGAAPAGSGPDGRDAFDGDAEPIRSTYTAGGPEGRVTHHPLPRTHAHPGPQTAQRPAAWDHRGQRSFLTAALLSILVGSFGVDRFYLGKIGTGVLKLVTLGGFGVWWIIDAILLLTNSTRDQEGRELYGYAENRTIAFVVAGVVGGLTLLNGFWFPVILF